MRLKKYFFGLGFVIMLLSSSGCVILIASTIGAVGGYAVTRDTIQGEYDTTIDRAVKATVKVCEILGAVTESEVQKGIVLAFVDQANVRVEITQLTPKTVRIKVKSRKGIFPRIGISEKVFIKIIQQVK